MACAERAPERHTVTTGLSRRELVGAVGELAERNQLRASNVAERAVEFVGLAHIEDLHVAQACSSSPCGWISQMPAKV